MTELDWLQALPDGAGAPGERKFVCAKNHGQQEERPPCISLEATPLTSGKLIGTPGTPWNTSGVPKPEAEKLNDGNGLSDAEHLEHLEHPKKVASCAESDHASEYASILSEDLERLIHLVGTHYGCIPEEFVEMREAAVQDTEGARVSFEAMARDLGLLDDLKHWRAPYQNHVFVPVVHEGLGLTFELAIPKNPDKPWELYETATMRIRPVMPGE